MLNFLGANCKVSRNLTFGCGETTELYRLNEEDFILHVQLTVEALSTQNLSILEEFKKIFITLMDEKYYFKLLTTASQQVEAMSPEIQIWIKNNLAARN